jgi:hypothetical protein
MIRQPDEKTEAAIDDFRFLVLSLKQIREPSRDLFESVPMTTLRFPPVHYAMWFMSLS